MEVNGITFNEDGVDRVLDHIDCYDQSVLVTGTDKEGNEYSAIGYLSCGKLVEVEKSSIEEIL